MRPSLFVKWISNRPLIRDVIDRRGVVRDDRGFLDLIKTGLPAVFAVTPALIAPIRDLLTPWPVAAVIGKVVMPLSLFALSLNAIVSRKQEVVEELPLYVGDIPKEWVYRFTISPRRLAKIAVIPLLVLSTLVVRDVIPVRWWGGQSTLAGYVCASRDAVAGSELEIVDALGFRAGMAETDDAGWFRVTLAEQARRPVYLRLIGTTCDAKELVALDRGESVRFGCPANSDPGNFERHGIATAWRAQCR